jgi:hypothetical protein
MEYIIQVSNFTKENHINNMSSINQLMVRTNEPKSIDEDDLDETELKAVPLSTVSGSLDLVVTETESNKLKENEASIERKENSFLNCQCNQKINSTVKMKENNSKKTVKKIFRTLNNKNIHSEKILFSPYPKQIRFSQEFYLNLDDFPVYPFNCEISTSEYHLANCKYFDNHKY